MDNKQLERINELLAEIIRVSSIGIEFVKSIDDPNRQTLKLIAYTRFLPEVSGLELARLDVDFNLTVNRHTPQ